MKMKGEEEIKKAFKKVKNDVSSLAEEVSSLKKDIKDIKEILSFIYEQDTFEKIKKIADFPEKIPAKPEKIPPTHNKNIPTNQHIIPTHNSNTSNTSTDKSPLESLKRINIDISTRNKGVPTDRQTNQQTDISHKIRQNLVSETKQKDEDKLQQFNHNSIENNPDFSASYSVDNQINPQNNTQNKLLLSQKNPEIDEVSKIMANLDGIKQDLKNKFKSLTNQELVVFSTIYSLEEQGKSTYRDIADKLNLSESSIRDYTNRLLKKGIPVFKEKKNNKQIILHISPELKKLASLETILKLREL